MGYRTKGDVLEKVEREIKVLHITLVSNELEMNNSAQHQDISLKTYRCMIFTFGVVYNKLILECFGWVMRPDDIVG